MFGFVATRSTLLRAKAMTRQEKTVRVQRAEIEEMEETLVKRAHRLEFKEVEIAASREALQSAERRSVSSKSVDACACLCR